MPGSDRPQIGPARVGPAQFVWNVLSALGQTTRGDLGTGVMASTFRWHPAMVAQASATLGARYPGRHWLGLGSGEAHNQHIVSRHWPEAPERINRKFAAVANALVERPNGGMRFPKSDIRSPFEFEQMAKMVRVEDFEGRMVISDNPDVHRAHIQSYVDLGFHRIYLRNVGRYQLEFVEVFGREVLPKLRR